MDSAAAAVQRSDDNGATWVPAATGVPSDANVLSFGVNGTQVLDPATRRQAPGPLRINFIGGSRCLPEKWNRCAGRYRCHGGASGKGSASGGASGPSAIPRAAGISGLNGSERRSASIRSESSSRITRLGVTTQDVASSEARIGTQRDMVEL